MIYQTINGGLHRSIQLFTIFNSKPELWNHQEGLIRLVPHFLSNILLFLFAIHPGEWLAIYSMLITILMLATCLHKHPYIGVHKQLHDYSGHLQRGNPTVPNKLGEPMFPSLLFPFGNFNRETSIFIITEYAHPLKNWAFTKFQMSLSDSGCFAFGWKC